MTEATESNLPGGVSRRTVVKGAAWAAPVIAAAAVVPAAAASLPPCVHEITGNSQNSWSVGASFPGCRQNSHFDVNVRVTIKPCDAVSIKLRVYDLGDESNGSGLRSRLWWSENDDTSPPYLFIEKSIAVPPVGTTAVDFAVEDDSVRSQQTFLAAGSSQIGTIDGLGGVNDGIHVNPCYFGGGGSSGRVAKLYYSLDNGPWMSGGYINATRPN